MLASSFSVSWWPVLLSMWMTNTSTTMMLLPIAVSVSALVIEKAVGATESTKRQFQVALPCPCLNHYHRQYDSDRDAT